jgi:alpha-L-fucosidase
VRDTPAWFRDAKFGIIIHWGLYSVPGWAPLDDSVVRLLEAGREGPDGDPASDPLARHSYAEWYQNSALLDGPTRDYHRATYGGRDYGDFRAPFADAVRGWAPESWAELFAASGARYVIPVTKHHDGFLLWPSTIAHPNRTGWSTERDVIGELGEAVRDRDLRYGLYYSGGPDWTFDHLPIRRMVDVASSVPDGREYVRYVDAHWRELIRRYRPSILWNDIGYPPAAEPDRLIADYYAEIPDGVVNDRFGAAQHDVRTPEYARRAEIDPEVWETVRAVGLSFGWNRQETEFLSVAELVRLLVDVVSKNGNLLLGVTPDDRGDIPPPQQKLLHGIGRWLAVHGEAIYGTRPWTTAEATTGDGLPVRFTRRHSEHRDILYGIVPGASAAAAAARTIPGLHIPAGSRVRAVGTDAFAVEPAPEI